MSTEEVKALVEELRYGAEERTDEVPVKEEGGRA